MSQKLRETIDRMVEDAIRRILPEVMNEVLVKMVANANIIQERTPRSIAQTVEKYERIRDEQPPAYRNAKNVKMPRKPTSLSQLLDPEAGADFYRDPREAMAESVREEPAPSNQPIAQRIQSLPPALQGLAEGMDLDDDGGEMWESDIGDSAIPTAGMGPPLERAAQVAGLDFSRMQRAIQMTEKKVPKVDRSDARAKAQFEEQRIKMMRERLNGGKPLE